MSENKKNVTRIDYEFLCDIQEAVGTVVEDEEKAIEAGHRVAALISDRGLWPSGEGTSPGSAEAEVMARVRSADPPEERGQYWLEEQHPFQDGLMPPKMKWVREGKPGELVVKPGSGHGKPVEEVDGLWTGPIPEPEQLSELCRAPQQRRSAANDFEPTNQNNE